MRSGIGTVSAISLAAAFAWSTAAFAHHPDDGMDDGHDEIVNNGQLLPRRGDPHAAMTAHDLATHGVVSSGPFAHVTKNLTDSDGALRVLPNATTDVWAHNGYAYVGTFNSPCGDGTGDNGSGIQIFDVSNHNFVGPEVASVPSVLGSRTNDVKVAAMNSGDILVHSNESCAGGPGGFEIWDVAIPTAPVHLASVQTDDVNLFLQDAFGFTDFGVHNLFLFSQGGNDYVAAVVESLIGNFQIFDITDPANPTLVGFWGAEQLILPGIDWVNTADFGSVILPANSYLTTGFGASQNKFLHDITITADGSQAYLANWDAGLVLLDISDVTDPQVVSVAIDPVNGSLDGEVNSHSVWPSEDGTIVVEGEEDFSAWEGNIPPGNLTLDGTATPGDPTIPATAMATNDGDDFEANQTGMTGNTDGSTVNVLTGALAGNSYPVIELATASGSPTFADIGTVSGQFIWLGRACTLTGGDALLNAGAVNPGDIAVVRRGACEFQEKADAAASVGAAAVIIANNQASTPWSGVRIWDYSDPANPVLASIFDTTCSASTEPGGDCDPIGTFSSHNVIVETTGSQVKAYISWYSDGVVVIDVTDPYNPEEVGRFHKAGAAFEEDNGGIQDVWGIYKVPGKPWIYVSDRNGGLYVLKEYGSGSAKVAKN